MNDTLYLFTETFPYGTGETFIENEIKVLSGHFQNIFIIPVDKKNNTARIIPANAIVFELTSDRVNKKVFKIFFENLFLVIRLLVMELIRTNKKKYFVKHFKESIGPICLAIEKSKIFKEFLDQQKNRIDSKNIFYSFWMNEGALILSILKNKKIIDDFVFRLHGYDLYEERRPGNYIPFRYFIFKMAKKIFCISRFGFDYLEAKNIFPEKLNVKYLGVFDNGDNPFTFFGKFNLVSCSNINSVKRVELIIEVLKLVNINVHWIHFGDGFLKEKVLNRAKELPPNIQVDIRGQLPNKNVLEYYKNKAVNLFILLSKTEGIPVALMEACSFGIPLLGTNVGGVAEIINEQTGILIPKDFDPKQVAEIINNFQNSKFNTEEFRVGVKKFWSENFKAENNYRNFVKQLKGI